MKKNKQEIQKLKSILKELKSLPAHDMAIAGAIFFVDMALRHLEENNHKAKILKKENNEKRAVSV
jgi:hypothetical protein